MNPRSQSTPGGAFARVKDILSAKVCARFLGVTEWTIYDRCDVQEFGKLNLSAAEMLELDVMCKDKCRETPLAKWVMEYLAAAPGPEEPTLETVALELARDVGEVEGQVLTARQSGARGLSNRKVIEIQNGLSKVKRDVAGMESIIEKQGGAA